MSSCSGASRSTRSVQAAADGLDGVGDHAVSDRGREQVGAVKGARVVPQLHVHSRLDQPLCVGQALIAKRVEFRHVDVSPGQAGQIRGPPRGRVRRHIVSAVQLAQVGRPCDLNLVSPEQRGVDELHR
jgi:hypothetical protein